ncbi:MAG: hypothetical protein IJF07_03045 [Lachnospiraceae bacterium]|nr:hypothetical protein [Lachnospiraceae bacterium]
MLNTASASITLFGQDLYKKILNAIDQYTPYKLTYGNPIAQGFQNHADDIRYLDSKDPDIIEEIITDMGSQTGKTAAEIQEMTEEAIEQAVRKVDEVVTPTLSGQWEKVNESMSEFSRTYQKQITGKEGMAWVQNGVKFDGMKDGVLLDAKGKYAQFIDKNTGEFKDWFSGKQDFIDEAKRQINASEGAKIQWYFAEEESLAAVQDLFMDNGITEIELIFEAPK